MTTVLIASSLEERPHPWAINLPDSLSLSDEDFFELCRLNRDLRIERTANGEIVVMSPSGGETGSRSSEINLQLRQWAKRDGTGEAFDSSTGFKLPNGADRSPDAAWVLRSRLALLTAEEKRKFLPLCPSFVIELRSPGDKLRALQSKMEEYINSGAVLGWLIDPLTRRIHIYQAAAEPEVVDAANEVSGEPTLPGFVLNLAEIWDPRI